MEIYRECINLVRNFRHYKKKVINLIDKITKAIAGRNPEAVIKIAASIFEEYPKAVILFGTEDIETGTAVALVETKSKFKLLDKISVNVYVGKSLKSSDWKAGIGIEKELFNINNIISIGGGYYITKEIKTMFGSGSKINHSIGLSLTGKF